MTDTYNTRASKEIPTELCPNKSAIDQIVTKVCQFQKTQIKMKSNSPTKPFHWDTKEEIAFQKIKNMFSKLPILGYADFELPFELHIDASSISLNGAVINIKSILE
ncbi:hypothetical protein MAR_033918 [Mya arenaria]|uniref:Reverse transcriptase/retrotransposon-derived protein RNase H-like domain-containing protein n=1 Tax=Mya arenaria TaxID=6604 RepID=A0ABY7GJ79_MYAAR|nr:hypothetical protein MAR_033918 [Mya arenaria]